jgi:hypothetical protein
MIALYRIVLNTSTYGKLRYIQHTGNNRPVPAYIANSLRENIFEGYFSIYLL